MLTIANITCRLGTRTLFDNASAKVARGQKIGVVGHNGSGKTTLFRLISGQLSLDGGRIDIAQRCRVDAISQDVPSGALSPLAYVLEADAERTACLAAADTETDPNEIARLHTRLVEIDAYSAPARAAVILAGLGFSQAEQQQPLDAFSGGWRMRVALARALFSAPDLLLLDEPTNHLDLESITWLASYLQQYENTLLLVSHDPDLLNQVAGGILHVNDGRLTMFSGQFDDFLRYRTQAQATAQAALQKQEAHRRHLQQFVDRFRAKATKAKQAQSRLKALARLPVIELENTAHAVRFNFPSPEHRPSPLLTLYDAAAAYGDRVILRDLNLSLYPEDRVALLGANGNGKTTLARLLIAALPLHAGRLVPAGKLRVGYFAQDHLEKLDMELSAKAQMQQVMPDAPQDKVRAWLGRFGFAQERAEVAIAQLSGGEKTRLSLALLSAERPNLLILDEPTNHLDMDARAALIEGLNDFEGAIVLISHDRTLIEATCEQLWRVADGTCAAYAGDLDDYRAQTLKERSLRARRDEGDADNAAERGDVRSSRKEVRKDAVRMRARLAPLRKAAQEAELALETLVSERETIEAQLSDAAVYAGCPDALAALSRRQRELCELIEAAEEAWLQAAEALEVAEDDEAALNPTP
ncbi:MAG: ATP-binding cassette domain-containing protein [Myxococcales bacterium]|jgi:ATP-binding cassette subfamily F protein 3|nr:ATP-binding cassette domain-containing protein [Myxococcales bacterium]